MAAVYISSKEMILYDNDEDSFGEIVMSFNLIGIGLWFNSRTREP